MSDPAQPSEPAPPAEPAALAEPAAPVEPAAPAAPAPAPAPVVPVAPARQRSPDGYWEWDGANWVAAQPQMPPPPLRAPRAPRKPLPWLRISAGVAAILGTTATLVGCILPYGSFPDPNGGATTSSSIFNGGFVGAGWDVPEPVLVIILAAVAASLVLAGINRAVQAISAGLLLAMGAQTATMWAAYVGLAASEGQVEAGGFVGLGGAALLLIGGALALVNMAWRMSQPAETPAAQAPA